MPVWIHTHTHPYHTHILTLTQLSCVKVTKSVIYNCMCAMICLSALEGIIRYILACKCLNVYTCFYPPPPPPSPISFRATHEIQHLLGVEEDRKYYVASHKFWKLINSILGGGSIL